ncbi:MAG TPA: hypothetical protein VGP44_00615, partial [Gemmatimonadales bacterium]|nr:hypothetical protein [Gemmatimonadales bacterium]
MRRIRRRVLHLLGRWERTIAWSMLGLSLIAFVSIALSIWKVDSPVTAALVALTLIWDGFS